MELSEHSAVPMVMLARQQDHVEFINSTLRKAGHAVHCHWVIELADLADTLSQINPQLAMAVLSSDAANNLTILTAFRQLAPRVPLIAIRDAVDEAAIAEAMAAGARDVVSFAHPKRLQAVVGRELQYFRTEYKLAHTLSAAHEYREQLKQLLSGSDDAIVHVQEGIMVDANPAWIKLLGYVDEAALNGHPVMDFFDEDSHATLKGALLACLQGKWAGHPLKVLAREARGATLSLSLQLRALELEGEPAVQLRVATQQIGQQDLHTLANDALMRDASTGMLQRRFFIAELRKRVAIPLKAGVREVLRIRPRAVHGLLQQTGITHFETFVEQFAAIVKDHLQPKDIAGRFGDCELWLLLERGNHADINAWASSVSRKLAAHRYTVGRTTLHCQAQVDQKPVPGMEVNLDELFTVSEVAPTKATTTQSAVTATEKETVTPQPLASATPPTAPLVSNAEAIESDTQQHANDRLWSRLIKHALMENRFRLLQQPIVTMSGTAEGMHDVLVRMLDELGQEIVPADFMAAAEHHDLMKNIDRWVIGAAMSFCSTRKIKHLFVRLSKDSILDRSLPMWLSNQLKATRIPPERIVFEIGDDSALKQTTLVQELARALQQTGFKLALEHHGSTATTALLESLPLTYIKLDGALMQGLAVDHLVQERLHEIITAAKALQILTIAERVEDANTMAVLWQLGVDYLQGYFVNEPEQVTLG